MNKRSAQSSMVFLIAFLTLSSLKAETLVVKIELDHGPGSLRWAVVKCDEGVFTGPRRSGKSIILFI